MDIIEDTPKDINSHFELGKKIVSDDQIQRTTKVINIEVGKLGILVAFAKRQNDIREKYHEIKDECFLSSVLDSNFKLRMSESGWRAIQIVEMVQSPKIEQQAQNTGSNIIDINKLKRM